MNSNYSKCLLHSLHQRFEGLPYGNITQERIKDFIRWHTFHNLSVKGFNFKELPTLEFNVKQNVDSSVTILGNNFFSSLILIGYYLPLEDRDVEAVFEGSMRKKYYWSYDNHI